MNFKPRIRESIQRVFSPFPNGIFITFPVNHFITKSTKHKWRKSRYSRFYRTCQWYIIWVMLKKSDWKTAMHDLVRQFATWLIVRGKKKKTNKQLNQTKTSQHKVLNGLKHVGLCSPAPKTMWSETTDSSGLVNSEQFLRNTVTGHWHLHGRQMWLLTLGKNNNSME